MTRTIKLTLTIKDPDDNTPTGKEIAADIMGQMEDISYDCDVIVDTEYDE